METGSSNDSKALTPLIEKYGDEIETLYDSLKRLLQKQLSEHGVEGGSVVETYIFLAIKERTQWYLRAGVEHVSPG